MKIKAKMIIIILLFYNNFQAQEFIKIDKTIYNCRYQYKFQEDSSFFDTYKNQEMLLQIGSKFSKFVSVNQLYSDSLIEIYKDEDPNVAFQKIWPLTQNAKTHFYCNYQIFKNYPDRNLISLTNYISKKHLLVKETLPFKWKIIANKDTTIIGYKCQQAITNYGGRNYIAWFSKDIPINDGPYKFCGLPGLIVKITDTKKQHSFELTSLQKVNYESLIVYVKYNYIEIKPAEYVRAVNTRLVELYGLVNDKSKVQFNDDENRIKAMDRLKSRNNYIEKY